tara:strand:- start:4160 stop:4672 length:513 start_codon:yes stop_codon:yes gene_type:complete
MSLANVQAQLGNILAALPLKVQKVDPSFLSNSTPPFEGAMTSDAQGQFYLSQINSEGNLAWQQIMDKTSVAEATSEFISSFELPVGYSGSSISYGETLQGDSFSVFVQFEPAANEDLVYVFSTENISSTGFDLYSSAPISVAGSKIHVLGRGYVDSGSGSIVGLGTPLGS